MSEVIVVFVKFCLILSKSVVINMPTLQKRKEAKNSSCSWRKENLRSFFLQVGIAQLQ